MRPYPDRYPPHPVFDAGLSSGVRGDEVGDLVLFGEPAIDLPHPHGASAAGRLEGIFVSQVEDAHVGLLLSRGRVFAQGNPSTR